MSALPTGALRARLLARVDASHRHESQFTTLRRDDAPWRSPMPGVRVMPLIESGATWSGLVELEAGACWTIGHGWNQCEWVVQAGGVRIAGMDAGCGDAAICSAVGCASSHLATSTDGASFYLRLSRAATPTAPMLFSTLDDTGWDDFCPGVRIRELWNGGERRSVLVRMRPGASVNAHGHALDEECMMLAGEAFIGDTLLRSGEFQLAPQGSRHGAISTDVGALFFVNGSLDPAAYA